MRSADGRPATPRLYAELAGWFHLLTAPEDYAEEAAFYSGLLIDACRRPPVAVLELGSGGGNNASHMKARFRMTLTDLSPAMLRVSRELNPECAHVQGDMRHLRLSRQFDAVFVHDAVSYLTTEPDLDAAIRTAFMHCRPGGAALFVPDHVRESFRPSTRHGGHDGPDRGLRYLEWTWDPDPDDTMYTMDFAYLLRDRDGSVRVEQDRHVMGLFPRRTWLHMLEEAGFDARAVPSSHSEDPTAAHEVFLATRPVERQA